MVLQQKTKTEFWGESAPGEKIAVSTDWATNTTTTANSSGKWRVRLKTPAAGGPYTIRISTRHTTLIVKDVLIGEVWLASGQSNMDIPLAGWPPGDTIENSRQEISSANYQQIRFFKVPFKVAPKPLTTVSAKWDPISPQNAGTYSATAYFFARRLQQTLHVPVGIIQSSIGGTPIEAWTSKSYLQKSGDFNDAIGGLDSAKLNSNSPTVLFNAMISPLIPYTIKGVIWYQGESNVGRAAQYKRLFPLMIQDWRNKWATELPFYFVQLAPYIYKDPKQSDQSQKLRDAQRYALHLPRTGMVTTLDIGYLKTAHPPYKREVGDRLARFAFKYQYGIEQVASGPLYNKTKVTGNGLVVEFTSVGTGLCAAKTGLDNFEIAGADKVYIKANASLSGNRVIVSHPSVSKPVYVRYAWSDSSTATLFNKEGLPAATFTSEK
ncbi:hypothetical protein N824_10465 [Pedobacter sp. V48]|nr:hypothetical protein N824_10465 [Pedobacter sp. V48]